MSNSAIWFYRSQYSTVLVHTYTQRGNSIRSHNYWLNRVRCLFGMPSGWLVLTNTKCMCHFLRGNVIANAYIENETMLNKSQNKMCIVWFSHALMSKCAWFTVTTMISLFLNHLWLSLSHCSFRFLLGAHFYSFCFDSFHLYAIECDCFLPWNRSVWRMADWTADQTGLFRINQIDGLNSIIILIKLSVIKSQSLFLLCWLDHDTIWMPVDDSGECIKIKIEWCNFTRFSIRDKFDTI